MEIPTLKETSDFLASFDGIVYIELIIRKLISNLFEDLFYVIRGSLSAACHCNLSSALSQIFKTLFDVKRYALFRSKIKRISFAKKSGW